MSESSMSLRPCNRMRRMVRPMRPKPLIAILTGRCVIRALPLRVVTWLPHHASMENSCHRYRARLVMRVRALCHARLQDRDAPRAGHRRTIAKMEGSLVIDRKLLETAGFRRPDPDRAPERAPASAVRHRYGSESPSLPPWQGTRQDRPSDRSPPTAPYQAAGPWHWPCSRIPRPWSPDPSE